MVCCSSLILTVKNGTNQGCRPNLRAVGTLEMEGHLKLNLAYIGHCACISVIDNRKPFKAKLIDRHRR